MATATHPVLLFVPLDDRPVSADLVSELARAAGVEVRTPERALLGDRFRAGDVNGVWSWLVGQAASEADALIASVEMLCFGGLVASRKSEGAFDEIAPRLRSLYEVAARVPAYISAVIPRTPVRPTDEDGPAVRRHRDRHLRLNADLIEAAARGAVRYLLIGQDDTSPGSLAETERAVLQTQAASRRTGRVLVTSGADELNARLLARWLNDLTGEAPAVRVRYTFPQTSDRVPLYESAPLAQTVAEHVESTGCRRMEDAPDILLWVHNFEDRQEEARDQSGALDREALAPILTALRAAAVEEQVAALADVRYANGADRTLVERLLGEPRMAGVVAYAGWNTCSNTLGSCLAQAVVAHHLRACNVPGSDRRYRPAFFLRLLDDWGYQSVVRPRLSRWLQERGGDGSLLSGDEAEAEASAFQQVSAEAVPALNRAFPYQAVTLRRLTFPWHRLFEVRLEFDVRTWGRVGSRGIIVVDYDPRWPQAYEEDRTAILRALRPLVRGIEHVGSTSVPGLAGKPIIDILLGVDLDDLDRVIEPLLSAGYEYNPDWEISMPNRRYLRRLAPDGRITHHLHVVPHGGEFWTRHLRFRDYLRAHPDAAQSYGELKKDIVGRHQSSIDYTFAKTEFIRSMEALAGIQHRRRPGARRP